jgi:hypothetical protein
MKQFLDDYGLKWITNDKQEGDFKLAALMNDLNIAKDEVLYNWDTKSLNMLNLESLIDKIELLNSKFLRNYKPTFRKDKDPNPDSIKMKFYKNGFKVGTLRYFSYISKEAHNILKDIMDGFFPSFLKNIFPEGILLKVVNKSYRLADIRSTAINKGPIYTPHGQLADSEDDIEKEMQIEKEKKQKDMNEKAERKHQEEIEKQREKELKKRERKTIKIHTPFDNLIRVSKAAAKRATTIRIRTVTLKTQLIIQLSKTEPVKTLFKWIDKYRDDNSEQEFELHTVFPIIEFRRTDTRTLEELGLYPERALSMHYLEEDY